MTEAEELARLKVRSLGDIGAFRKMIRGIEQKPKSNAHGAGVAVADRPDFKKVLPVNAQLRKGIPLQTGLFDYFPDALVAVAVLSRIGNDQHNPGEPLHWSRDKSMDHGDTLLRHQMQHGLVDDDRVRHSTKVAWRSLAQLQLELEAAHRNGCV